MPIQRCTCGAKYRLPESAVGKRVKCKKCGAVFSVKTDRSPDRDASMEDDVFAELAAAATKAKAAPVVPRTDQDASAQPSPSVVTAVPRRAPQSPQTSRALGAFITDFFKSMQLLFSAGNLIVFLIVWFLLVLGHVILPFAFCLGWPGMIVITGWYCTFRFDVIGRAVAGDSDLPTLSLSQGAMDDIILPLVRWLASWLYVLAPAIAYYVYRAALTSFRLDPNGQKDLLKALLGGITGLLQSKQGDDTVLVVLLYAGLALWPMVILCVTVGGFETLLRVDQMLLTVLKTLPAYLLTTAVIIGTELTCDALDRQLRQSMIASAAGAFNFSKLVNRFLLWAIAAQALYLFFDILSLRAIGIYYRNFKHRFAWEWE